MTKCIGFRTFKERGEWVELQFMARAVRNGFKVSKPWGDSSAYDVGIESGERILRVQVKSTDCRTQYGYLCQFKPSAGSKPYTLKQVDFFAAYVIPKDVWYLIPAAVLLGGKKQKKAMTILPEKPRHPERYKCEEYREGWELMLPEGGGTCLLWRARGPIPVLGTPRQCRINLLTEVMTNHDINAFLG
jgi:hypothetical protein